MCRKYTGELRAQKEEAYEQCFFDLTNLPDNISPVNTAIIRKLAERSVIPAQFQKMN